MKKLYCFLLAMPLFLGLRSFAQAPCTTLNYGASNATSTLDEEILRVSVGTMNNVSACGQTAGGAGSLSNRYGNYSGIVAAPQLAQGSLVPWLVQAGTCNGWYGTSLRIYVDWNQDGLFTGANELMVNIANGSVINGNNTGNFTVPAAANIGFTRMRIILIEGTQVGPTGTYSWGETEDYCVQVTGLPCSGAPNAGIAAITSTMGCPNNLFTLSTSGSTGGVGISYQWFQSSNANGPWTPIANATNSSFNYSVASTTYFQMVVTCTNSNQSATTSVVSYSLNNPGPCVCSPYGVSAALYTGDEEIFNVSVGTLNNVSTCTTTAPGPGSSNQLYSNYAGFLPAPDFCQGSTQNFTVNIGTCVGWYGVQYRIYIDWNQDGLFTGLGEMIVNATAVQGNNVGSFIVPQNALTGLTRMRVIAVEGTVPGPTGTYAWGETEDDCVNVLASPVISASGGSLVCGNPFTITPSGANTYTYISSLGGPSSTGSSITFTPLSNVNYTVIGTAANNCTASINNVAITVLASSFLTVTPLSATICPLAQTQFTASGANSYTWQGGVNSTTATLNASGPLSAVNYTIRGADASGCLNFATVTVNAYPNPTVNITSTANICLGGSATLSALGAVNYTWSNTLSGSTTVVSPTITSTFSVLGQDAQTCTTSAQYVLVVKPIPILTITASQNPYCKGQLGTLTALGASSYTWGNGSTANTTTIAPQNSGYITVIAVNTVNCLNADSIMVNVFNPSVSITGPTVTCSGQAITLSASSANTYTWSNNWFGQLNTVSPNSVTVYSVAVSSTSNNITCNSSAVNHTVTVNTSPVITAQISQQFVCKGQTFIMSASGANSYTWSTGASTASVSLNEPNPGVYTYFVSGSSTEGCKSNKVTLGITVSSCSGIEENESQTYRMYPNPSNGLVTLESGRNESFNVNVTDLTGREVLSLQAQNSACTLNIQDFANGVYFVKIQSIHGNQILRLVKE